MLLYGFAFLYLSFTKVANLLVLDITYIVNEGFSIIYFACLSISYAVDILC